MNEIPSSPMPKKALGKTLPWLWIVPTAIIALACAAAPVALAQGREAGGNAQDAQQSSRRYIQIIQNVFDFIQRHYVEEIDPKQIYEGAMNGMFNALGDPYSVYMPESEMNDLHDTTQGSFGGVGLYISKSNIPNPDGRPNYLEVASPMEDTPGWKAGINPGDYIIEIEGESTAEMTLDQVVSKLRGPAGTEVKIRIRRGEKLEFPATLTRAVIEVPTTKHAMIGSDTGYLRLITFTPNTVERARDAINEFASKGYKNLILDLRNNYGGLLTSAVNVCDLFLDGGVVVSTKSRIPQENSVFNARKSTLVPASVPVIVLINKGSASASEIVAGALKDRGRAYLVGEKSYGKGSVQQVYPLDKTGFKITTSRYYTPSDVNIDKIGIPPDREIKTPEFTDSDAEALGKLIQDRKIPAYIEKNPRAGTADITAFAGELSAEYKLDVSLLRRLIRNEQNRTTIAPVFDLEYDLQLEEAVKIIRNSDFGNLMKTTKTLKTLQEEAAREDEALAS
ncbi:MAG: S41 family peptidase [Treponema sp.]|jgi:carboxyl-terminal processing protease|nr:S41 family peptidase [Treponema sp.]